MIMGGHQSRWKILRSAAGMLLFAITMCVVADESYQGLPGALQAMYANNPAIQSKRAKVQAAGYDIDSLKAVRYPRVSLQSSYHDDGSEQGVLQLQQSLWAFGKIDNPIARAEAQFASERLALLQVVRQLMEETAVAYVQIEQLRLRERVATESVTDHQRLYDQIVRRQLGQLASEADVLLASSRLAQAQSQQQQIAGELRVAMARLQNLTRRSVDTMPPVEHALAHLPDEQLLEQAAMENSADIRLKASAVTVAVKSIAEERSSSMPTLYLGVNQQLLDVPAGVDETVVMIGFEGAVDGLGLASRGRVRSVTARANAARQDLISTRNDVQQRVHTLLANRDMQHSLLASQKASIEALAGTMASYERQYAAGRKAWLEVLNIQRELAQQRLQAAQSEGEWLKLSLQLAIMIGELDKLVGIDLGDE
jgi:adhesin transport system outer membrane protein